MDEKYLDWQLSVGAFDVGDHGGRLAVEARSFVIQESSRQPHQAEHVPLVIFRSNNRSEKLKAAIESSS